MTTPKAVHLYNLAHFAPLSPILAAHSVASDNYNHDHALSAHAENAHCTHCGIMLIPGLTASIRIKYTKKGSGVLAPGRLRTLVVTCGHCSHQHQVCTLVNRRKATAPAPAPDKKKKKKKNSELASLLASRKAEAPKSLSLFEFMQ